VPSRLPIREKEGKAERKVCRMQLRDTLELTAAVLYYDISSSIDIGKVLVDDDTNLGGRGKIISTGVPFLGVKCCKVQQEVNILAHPLLGGLVYGVVRVVAMQHFLQVS